MTWKFVGGIWFAIALGIGGAWFAHGMQMYTKDQERVVTKRINPDFGNEEQIVEWRPHFRLGLDFGAPAIALCCAVGVVAWRIGVKKSQA